MKIAPIGNSPSKSITDRCRGGYVCLLARVYFDNEQISDEGLEPTGNGLSKSVTDS
jgi:hypothetical protein